MPFRDIKDCVLTARTYIIVFTTLPSILQDAIILIHCTLTLRQNLEMAKPYGILTLD